MKLYKQMVIEQRYGKVKTLVTNNYEEVTKSEVLDILLEGNRQCLYVRQVNKDGIRHFQAHDGDIKRFITHQRNIEGLKVKVDVDMSEVKQYVTDTIELLDHDIVIGINKDLELPTVLIDGEKVEDGLIDLNLRWRTSNDSPVTLPKSFRLNTLSKQNEEKGLMIKHEN